ncbi:unnamed protein product, partial [Staurois parvus]
EGRYPGGGVDSRVPRMGCRRPNGRCRGDLFWAQTEHAATYEVMSEWRDGHQNNQETTQDNWFLPG